MLRSLTLVAVLAGAWSCAGDAGADDTLVLASASLGPGLEALAREHERREPGARVRVSSAGTARLLVQLREGAPADLFAAADGTSARAALAERGLGGEPVAFARNRLVIAVAEGNPRRVAGLADLAREDLTLALCAPEVPAGRYARALLSARGVAVRSISDEPSVRALVAKVALGELDAAVVYATDVATDDPRVDALTLDDAAGVTGWLAVLADGERRDAAERFATFVRSNDGVAILRAHGFDRP